jgi:hypothetical protein
MMAARAGLVQSTKGRRRWNSRPPKSVVISMPGFRVGGHRVVVGDRNGPHAEVLGEADQLGRRKIAVAALVRMDVEIDPSAHARSSRPVRTL